ncbi:MAG: glycosyltransferase, partial [Lachnospiraceae bacterium]|nr:glycosyltransferase [Lachnospiraceae bacterium]
SKASDMFLLTSTQEGLPVALMQAMACGLPVVCSRIRGNTDLIENKKQGFMCSYNNVGGFCKGINILLDNPKLRKKMGARNVEAIKRYDKKYVNERIREIYLSLTD